MRATALRSRDRISCCRPMCRRRARARKNWCATHPFSPTASSSGCRTRKCAPPFWCSMPAATIRSNEPGTRAVAGGGGLAPMTQLPEGVFSVFSAGPRQTALDRLSNNDDNPNSVFTRTFSKELLQPGENLVQVAQHTRRIVSEMAETVSHKQIPVYFDQMVDDVFLNGVAKGPPEAG